MEYASYRVMSDGAFVHRSLEHVSAAYYSAHLSLLMMSCLAQFYGSPLVLKWSKQLVDFYTGNCGAYTMRPIS